MSRSIEEEASCSELDSLAKSSARSADENGEEFQDYVSDVWCSKTTLFSFYRRRDNFETSDHVLSSQRGINNDRGRDPIAHRSKKTFRASSLDLTRICVCRTNCSSQCYRTSQTFCSRNRSKYNGGTSSVLHKYKH